MPIWKVYPLLLVGNSKPYQGGIVCPFSVRNCYNPPSPPYQGGIVCPFSVRNCYNPPSPPYQGGIVCPFSVRNCYNPPSPPYQGGNGDAAYPLEMSLRFLPSTSSASLRHCVKLLFHSCGFAWIGGWLALFTFHVPNQNNSYFNNRHSIGPLYSVNRFAVRSPIDFANFRLPVNR